MNWKQDRNDLFANHSAIWGEHPGVCIIVYEYEKMKWGLKSLHNCDFSG